MKLRLISKCYCFRPSRQLQLLLSCLYVCYSARFENWSLQFRGFHLAWLSFGRLSLTGARKKRGLGLLLVNQLPLPCLLFLSALWLCPILSRLVRLCCRHSNFLACHNYLESRLCCVSGSFIWRHLSCRVNWLVGFIRRGWLVGSATSGSTSWSSLFWEENAPAINSN